ncbi:Ig-like domain-containing protein [Rosenbergiella epipactidis]|uniref:Ig-like domain-containing protein n=1 Tax=Rosenbergiella epipactidis TaxID=1544694 RepID=UPI002026BD83|nr:Ig-like domain-containing protein [Rosenbergiella epipactidis]MCL9667296.1 Ig-like domain-containing protein [Rosenbergiella epipactidis]
MQRARRTLTISAYLHRLAVALVLCSGIGGFPAFSAVKLVDFGMYDAVGNIPIGFSFNYYGKPVETVEISRYGILTMESGRIAPMYNNFPLPYRRSALYVFWDSLDAFNPESVGRVHYETQGVAPHRQFIVQWSHFTTGLITQSVGDFQIILDESSGSIKYQYRNQHGSATVGRNATIGIEGPNQKFIQIGYRDQYAVGDQQAILFTPLRDSLDYSVNKQADFSFIDLTLAPPPTGHYLLPKGNEVSGEVVDIEIVTDTSEVQHIASVDFFVNEQWLSRQLTTPWRTTWSTTAYEKGRYRLKAVIANRDNRTTTITKTVLLQREPPPIQASPYLAEIMDISPPVSWQPGQSIVLKGKAWTREGTLLAKQQPLILHLRRDEQIRSFHLTSDTEGNFHYSFLPKFSDNGQWQATVTHPDEKALYFQPEQSFRVEQLLFSPTQQELAVSNNEPMRISSEATTAASVKGLYWTLRAKDQPSKRLPAGVSLGKTPGIDIAAGKQAKLTTELTILPTAGSQGQVTLTALSPLSDDHSRGQLSVNWHRVPDRAKLALSPQRLNIGLTRGTLHTETVQLKNEGNRPAEQLQLRLVDDQGIPAPNWIFFSSPTDLGTLAQGQTLLFELTAVPPATVDEGDYRFRVMIKDDRQAELSLPVQLAISQSGQARLSFHLTDIYTATKDKTGKDIAGINGASIVLQNEAVLSQLWTLTSNEQGEASIKGLAPGTYLWRISADQHQSRQGRMVVNPGENVQSVFLDYQTVTIHFEVKPTTIDDRYEIDLNTTFQTDVPAPVLVISPAAINLAGLTPGSEKRGTLTLSNHGLVHAENIEMTLPASDPHFTYYFTQSIPKTLLPGEQISLGYQVTARPPSVVEKGGMRRNESAANAECSAYHAPVRVGWQSTCASGQRVAQQSQALFYELSGASCSQANLELDWQGGNADSLDWLPIASNILTAGCAPDCDAGCCQPQGKVAGDR